MSILIALDLALTALALVLLCGLMATAIWDWASTPQC